MTDWKLFANQKATLNDIINNAILTDAQKLDLQGILNFLDAEHDLAAERLDTVVFLNENNEFVDCDSVVRGNSDWTPGPQWKRLMTNLINSEDDTGCDGLTVVDKGAFDELHEEWNNRDD